MWIILHVAPLQPHHSHRAVGADLEAAAVVDCAGVAEAALLHHAARCGVVGEEVAPDGAKALLVEAVVDQQLQGLGADALVPVGPGHPVTRFGIVLADVDVALFAGVVADAADGLTSCLELDGPDMVAVEHRADDFQALFHALVGRPARAGPHLGVGGILVQGFGIAFTPRPEQDSGGLHHACSSFVSLLLSVGFPRLHCVCLGVLRVYVFSIFCIAFEDAKIRCSFGTYTFC